MDKVKEEMPLFTGSELKIAPKYSKDALVTLYQGDRLLLLEQIDQAGSKAELIVTSPPYNLGKEYEEQTSLEKYIEGQRATIAACLEILSPTGSICWQVGNYI
jgi:DNA modification methylase